MPCAVNRRDVAFWTTFKRVAAYFVAFRAAMHTVHRVSPQPGVLQGSSRISKDKVPMQSGVDMLAESLTSAGPSAGARKYHRQAGQSHEYHGGDETHGDWGSRAIKILKQELNS
ncbi:hypothetical protein PGTUg99_017127 [Puccinia graminis f. sp. tritici]|uniref:Uncharacterized protein n=1 Tax=Puccinia graminis f. sp. tritici TaxID=56615 RepID=A0A5B0RCA7_PUCGR|nr:hypothetical protein PGTUg99_017127 [Puccinia graminis f. sp. tritici]